MQHVLEKYRCHYILCDILRGIQTKESEERVMKSYGGEDVKK